MGALKRVIAVDRPRWSLTLGLLRPPHACGGGRPPLSCLFGVNAGPSTASTHDVMNSPGRWSLRVCEVRMVGFAANVLVEGLRECGLLEPTLAAPSWLQLVKRLRTSCGTATLEDHRVAEDRQNDRESSRSGQGRGKAHLYYGSSQPFGGSRSGRRQGPR